MASSHEPVDVALVSALLEKHYRVSGDLERLATEKDDTFRLRSDAGSSIPVAAGAAVLDVFEQENVQQRVLENGTALREGLQELTQASPYVAEVRGSGLYVGVELVKDRETREPDRARAEDVITDLRDRRVLISGAGKAANVLKIRPPLAFTSADVTRFLETFAEVAKVRL